MAHTSPSLDELPLELVAEITSHLDSEVADAMSRGRVKPCKDAANFAMVSKRYGEVASRILFRHVRGARNWDEHFPQDADSDLRKLNLAPLQPGWELLLGTAQPMRYVRKVTLASFRQYVFLRVSPNKVREALLSLPCLKEVRFEQTEALDDPVAVSADSRLLKVADVDISQKNDDIVSDDVERHLPRLLAIFDEIGDLSYASDHYQVEYEVPPEPHRPRVKVSTLRLRVLPIVDESPVGALKAINDLVELSSVTAMRIFTGTWPQYLACGMRFNEMIRGASNLRYLLLYMPRSIDVVYGAPDDTGLDLDVDLNAEDYVGAEAASTAGEPEDGSIVDEEDHDMDEDANPEVDFDEHLDPDEHIDLSPCRLDVLELELSSFGDATTWEHNLAHLHAVASSDIKKLTVVVDPEEHGETLAHYKTYLPGIQGLADHVEELKRMLCDEFKKLEEFTISSLCHEKVAEEMQNAINACFEGSRAQALCKWDIETWGEFEAHFEDQASAPN